MSNCPFCDAGAAPDSARPNPGDGKRPPGLARRAWRSVQWLFPAAVLALMPKCPMCVAAYVALFTGMSITVATARWIHILVPLLCWIALACLLVRHWRARLKARGFPASSFS